MADPGRPSSPASHDTRLATPRRKHTPSLVSTTATVGSSSAAGDDADVWTPRTGSPASPRPPPAAAPQQPAQQHAPHLPSANGRVPTDTAAASYTVAAAAAASASSPAYSHDGAAPDAAAGAPTTHAQAHPVHHQSLPPPPRRPSVEGFVQPASYLRRARGLSRPMPPAAAPGGPPRAPETAVERDQLLGLRRIRAFLKARTSYDVLPLSFRLIVFDTALLVKNSLNILIQNGIASAPLWDSRTSTFAGLLTTSDYINVIQYYYQHPEAIARIDQFRLDSLRDVEKALDVVPLETASIHPLRPLYEACRRMLDTRARRIPLIDADDDTRRATLVNVVTQYRILKFVAVNVPETRLLRAPLRRLRARGVGTYQGLATARMETPVMDVIHQLVRRSISSVPILNSDGILVNVFEAVDVITLIKGGVYDDLGLTVGEALQKRAPDFPGIFTCSLDDRLDSIFDTIRKSRVHRLAVVDEDKRLNGVLTLSDILQYILLEGEGDD